MAGRPYRPLIIERMADQPADLSPSTIGAPPPPPRAVLSSLVDRNIELLRRRRTLVVGSIAAVVFLLLILAISHALYGSAAWAYDFKAYHDAVLRLLDTGSPYQPARTLNGPFQAGPFDLYLYSPVPVVLMLPFGWLSMDGGALVFLVIRLAMLIGLCALMPITRTAKLATLAVACVSAPVLQDLNLGNASLIVTFLAVVAWRFVDRPLGSVAIALAASIRPTMAIYFVWWLLRREWRAAVWLVLAGLGLVLITLPFVGVHGWTDFVTLLGNLTNFEGVYRNFALGALVTRAGAPEFAARAALFAGYAAAGIAVALSMRRDRDVSFVVTLGATLLLSPLLWDHYMTNLLVPAGFLVSRGRPWGVLLPLLCWLPQELLAFIAIAAMVLPFAAPDRGQPVRSLLDRLPGWREPAPA
jgi:alpha-1,2-mannosyltransferase